MEAPDVLRHRPEGLRLVDRERLLLRQVTYRLDRVVALAAVGRKTRARQLAQQVRFDQRPTQLGQRLEIVGRFGERNAREIDAQEFGIEGAVGRRMQDGIDVTEDLFRGVVVRIANSCLVVKLCRKVFLPCINPKWKYEPII